MSYVKKIVTDLETIGAGMALMGMTSYPLQAAAQKLLEQEEELVRYRGQNAYKAGQEDGWNAAFASGMGE